MKPFCYHPFDLRQLVSFAEIARTGSFRQAAKTLHIAQPALSRQIKQLEAALGICLFDRAPPRLHLTIEGRELAGRLPTLFAQIDQLIDAVQGTNAGGTTQLRVGDGGALTTEVIAPALRRLRQTWPQLRLSTVQNTSEGFFQDLLENRIDCAFPALDSKHNELISHKLCRLEVGLVLPPAHRLAGRSEIRLEQLRNERWIMPPRDANPVLYDELISCCHKAGFTPDVIAEMTQRPRVVSQVACGIGIATLVTTMAHLCIGGTTFHRLVRPTPMLECYLVYRKNASSPLLKCFIAACIELARDFRH
ncbi:MAG TPA: LysR family transcriptional regulator [Chthoniobacterales bacterium]|nr:LysR family transcriptional regulator [Chthoniobacterales bacterium]